MDLSQKTMRERELHEMELKESSSSSESSGHCEQSGDTVSWQMPSEDLHVVDHLVSKKLDSHHQQQQGVSLVIADCGSPACATPQPEAYSVTMATPGPSPQTVYQPTYSPAPPHTTQATSMPSNTEYPGQCEFEVVFSKQQRETKSTTWTYSVDLKKLFANLESLCPIKFRCSHSPPPGSIIRIMPIYMQPEHIQEPVARCPNHITKDTGSHPYKSHLIRCENPNTLYHLDQVSNRESLTIPFEEPQAGADTSTSLFQFMCYSSCVGGLNRRPLQVVFTLETMQGQVIGRRVVEVRICACPGRDRKSEEEAAQPGTKTKTAKKGKNVTLTQEIITKKRKAEEEEEELFFVPVRGREKYELLLKMRDALDLAEKAPAVDVARHQRQYEEINRRSMGQASYKYKPKKKKVPTATLPRP